MENLIQRLNLAIDAEYDAKNQEAKDLLTLPIETRVLKGNTITKITARSLYLLGQGNSASISFNKVIATCNDNISKFREGSHVILSGYGKSFKFEVIEDNGNEMILEETYYQYSIPSNLNGTSDWQIDEAPVDIRHIVKNSTAILNADPGKFRYLSGILNGTILPSFSSARTQKAIKIAEGTNMNQSQKEAFIKAYSAENYFLIQGPPGSGKTWLLAHLALEFAKEGNKVLVTAFTHNAISNALQKTSTLSHYPDIIKVGTKIQSEGLYYNGSTAKNISDFRRSGYDDDSKGIIVGATCYSPHTKKLEFMDWDVIIIDEAGQLSIPLAMAAMVKGKKFIFIGDHKQLPPIISDNQDDVVFTKSIFEHLFNFAPGLMLNTTYRMNKEINRFPSKQFYGGILLPEAKNANWILNIANDFDRHQSILDITKPEVLFCHHHQSHYSRSEFEANMIAEFVEEYIKRGIAPDEIAVITPFRVQMRQIKTSLEKLEIYDQIKDKLFVDTIERIQGQERDIVIYSLATSDPIKAEQRADFFFNPNRFNVALTRAKKKRIVIGNKSLFEYESKDRNLNLLIQNFKDFFNDASVVEENPETEDLF
jgi:DNA replication ATP-dependent helicase Dna2